MEQPPSLIGRKYSNEEKIGIAEVLKEWSKESGKKVEGELEKTEKDIRMISIASSFIEAELTSLGIDRFEAIKDSNVHFVASGELGGSESGHYSAVSDSVIIDTSGADTQSKVLATTVHELVHRASTQLFHAEEDGGIVEARVGYRIRSPWKEPIERQALTGFNEIMVESTVMKILARNAEQIQKEFGISLEDIRGPIYHYMEYSPVLSRIVAKVAEQKGTSPSEVFNDFERGQFDSNILVLKDIEKAFGKGSIEVLSYMGVISDPVARQEIDEKVQQYFESEDESEKTTLARTLEGLFGKARRGEVEAEDKDS